MSVILAKADPDPELVVDSSGGMCAGRAAAFLPCAFRRAFASGPFRIRSLLGPACTRNNLLTAINDVDRRDGPLRAVYLVFWAKGRTYGNSHAALREANGLEFLFGNDPEAPALADRDLAGCWKELKAGQKIILAFAASEETDAPLGLGAFIPDTVMPQNFMFYLAWHRHAVGSTYSRLLAEAFDGKADRTAYGNRDGRLDALELAGFMDAGLGIRIRDAYGQRYFRGRMVYLARGAMMLTGGGG